VTSDAEFHSARRLLQRWQEEGLEVLRVPARPAASIGERMARVVDDSVAAVIVSSVFFDSGEIAGGLEAVARRCEHTGAELLVDAYHQLNVVPFSLAGFERAYIVGGGYKYCQLGEGNAFLRAPPDCALRPAITGWFADFDALEAQAAERVGYGALHSRFAGATYDPTSHYRAAEVFEFFRSMNLGPVLLREVSQHQIALLRSEIDALDAPEDVLRRSEVPLEQLAGFLALHAPRAAELQRALAARGVLCDVRGETLRLGPAPYLTDAQLQSAVQALGEVIRTL
jgi:kynureninase